MTKLISTKDTYLLHPFVKTIRGKIGRETGKFGTFNFGDYEFGADNSVGLDTSGVYQMRHCLDGIIPVKMKFRKNNNRIFSAALIASENKFKNAQESWFNLTIEQQQVYNERAKRKKMYGRNLFIREYMLS